MHNRKVLTEYWVRQVRANCADPDKTAPVPKGDV